MMRRHPLPALFFIWICDLVGLAFVISALSQFPSYGPETWIDFAVWTLLLCIAHLGMLRFIGLKVYNGWFTAVDFAAALILPFPLFCLTMLIWLGLTVAKRFKDDHREPLLGPDFNAANVTLNGAAATLTYTGVDALLQGYPFGDTIALLLSALVFIAMQIALVSTLLSLDQQIPWRKVCSLDADALVSEGMMVTAGALLGRIYQYDPYLLLLTIVPLLFLHKTLSKLNHAKLAYIDGKTGVYNYRYFDETLATSFRKAVHSGRPLSVIFGDMDHLRDVNNTHGHMIGDLALIEVAKAFRESGAAGGVPCRFGGEEFVLLLPDYDKVRALEVAERVRRAVAAARVPLETGGTLSVTISLGVSSFPEDATSVEELVKAADEAVYQAKHTGRNRVCAYQKCKLAL